MPFVLDCSMTMAWVFRDEATERTDSVRDSLLGDSALAPWLCPLEVANVLLAATRRRRIARTDWEHVEASLSALPTRLDVEPPGRVFASTLPLAHEHGLSVHDATYLELALRTQLPVATLDRELARACARCGVALL